MMAASFGTMLRRNDMAWIECVLSITLAIVAVARALGHL